MGRLDEAIQVLAEMERSPPPYGYQSVYWSNYALNLAWIGRIREARDKASNLTGLLATQVGSEIALSAADWSTADSLARLYLRDRPGEAVGPWARGAVAASRGQVKGAMSHLSQSVEADRTASGIRTEQACGAMLVLAVVSGAMLDVGQLRLVRVDTAPGASLALLWAAAAGDTAGARAQLAAIRAMPAAERGPVDTVLTLGDAWLALAAGQPEAAIMLIRPVVLRGMHRAQGPIPINQLLRWTLAEAYTRINVPDSAAAWLERIAQWEGQVWAWDNQWRGLTYSFVHFRLGQIYMQVGRIEDAKQHYATFLDAFTDPDAEYQWMVTEAHAKLQEPASGR